MAEHHDEQTERLVRRLVEANDPMRGKQIGPPRRSAAELRRLVDQRRVDGRWRATSRPGVRLRLVAPAAAVVLGITALVLVNALPDGAAGRGERTVVAMAVAPAALGLQFPGPADPAAPWLRELAERTAGLEETAGTGRYTYQHSQTWSIEDTGSDPDRANAVIAQDERLWWAEDGSGREEITALPPQAGNTDAAQWLDGPPPGSDANLARTDYRPGEMALVVDDPATDPAVLTRQLSAHEPFSNGPQAVIRAVADLYRFHEMSPALRAAVLNVLTETNGLVYRGRVVDRAGRTGVAVSVDSDAGATRDLAVLDPDTGTLLSYEQVALISPPRSAVRAPAVISYVLYLAHQRTDQLG
ncbi:CU044_5270 family protein [Micromonospora sp. NBC_01796]|uniref:CU044_5270 family protein n=1 Tax=Micromonospora sp. NBC_01796 TaxID=2975987 RepID=UPI002DD87850|nr:CU044_5270 family protein [Micromonospora sp. NBC_01796]WSA83125.1 CU044_5270 family protein [Micromonospora sp. NBC_01796]